MTLVLVGISGLRILIDRGGRRYERLKGIGVAGVDGRGAGRILESLALLVDDLEDSRLGQHPRFPGAGVDPGDGLLRRIPEQAVTRRAPQARGQGDLVWRLPGVGRGDLGRAVSPVLDAAAADPDGAEGRLEGERGGTAAEDPSAVLASASGQDELGVGPLDGVLEQPAFEDLAAALDARLESSGERGVLLGHGQFQSDLGVQGQAVVLDLDVRGGDRSLDLQRGTHGEVLRWRGGIAMRALLQIPSQVLQIREQIGDRQEKVPEPAPGWRHSARCSVP
jgi:hypothetical protein